MIVMASWKIVGASALVALSCCGQSLPQIQAGLSPPPAPTQPSAPTPPPRAAAPCAVAEAQCPAGTYLDNTVVGQRSFESSVRAAGAAVRNTGSGECRFTCRQLCPDRTAPHVEETSSQADGSVVRKFWCDELKTLAYIETSKANGTDISEKLIVPVECQKSGEPFARDYCDVRQCNVGWVRGRIQVDPTGDVIVQMGLETDDVFKGRCGSLSWSVLDAEGKTVGSGETGSLCVPGKGFGGTAVIRDMDPKVERKLVGPQMTRVASARVIARCNQ